MVFSDGQEPVVFLGVMFQPHNKDEKTKDVVVLCVRGFEFFEGQHSIEEE